MDIKALRELKPLKAAFLTLITLAAIVVAGIAIRYLVPFLWDMTCIAASALWSVFVYWNQKSSYCGAIASFLTVWAGLTVFTLTFNDAYLRERRYFMVIAFILSLINFLFFCSSVAASSRGEMGFWLSMHLITALTFPVITVSLINEHWKAKKKIAKYGE